MQPKGVEFADHGIGGDGAHLLARFLHIDLLEIRGDGVEGDVPDGRVDDPVDSGAARMLITVVDSSDDECRGTEGLGDIDEAAVVRDDERREGDQGLRLFKRIHQEIENACMWRERREEDVALSPLELAANEHERGAIFLNYMARDLPEALGRP